jgi:osmotically inducible protein OsmC
LTLPGVDGAPGSLRPRPSDAHSTLAEADQQPDLTHPTTSTPTEEGMPTRTARTSWTGTLQQGTGTVELASSQLGTYEVSFPKRVADDADGATSPEELIAAAHSACYAMALSGAIAQAGGTPRTLDVRAAVSLGPDPAGGFRLTGITLTVRGEVDGLDGDGFAKAAQEAKVGCPVSKALAGVEITLDAALND